MKLLLGQGKVSPNKPGNDSPIPLGRAARNEYKAVVQILFQWDDINTGKPDNCGQIPLWWAAENGHKGIVKILLERGEVASDKPEEYGEPLVCCFE